MFIECHAIAKFLYYNEAGFKNIRTEKGFPERAGALVGWVIQAEREDILMPKFTWEYLRSRPGEMDKEMNKLIDLIGTFDAYTSSETDPRLKNFVK